MNHSVVDLIRQRFSCRRHPARAIEADTQKQLQEFVQGLASPPFGSPVRFMLIAASGQDRQELKGVGTYGVVKNPAGFIIGAVGPGERNLEDFGYLMERAILFATGLGLGTCWLGGSLTKSSFAKRIGVLPEEIVPAVTSVGYIEDQAKAADWIRRRAGGAMRLPPEQLFFDEQFGKPILMDDLGAFATILEMVRWGPSASNKQPWRIVRTPGAWNFYLQRTPGYGKDSFLGRLIGVADVQRIDLGIAMCHFELAARELGQEGVWRAQEPAVKNRDKNIEYVASWLEAGK